MIMIDGFSRGRLKERLDRLYGDTWPAFTVCASWRRLDEGGVDDIIAWARSVSNPRLVTIDLIKNVRPKQKTKQSDFDADYESLQLLRPVVDAFPKISSIGLHHDRKMQADNVFDTISGTYGVTAGADGAVVMKHARGGGGVIFHGEGRDFEPFERLATFNKETCMFAMQSGSVEDHL
jgi:hypothetical protein